MAGEFLTDGIIIGSGTATKDGTEIEVIGHKAKHESGGSDVIVMSGDVVGDLPSPNVESVRGGLLSFTTNGHPISRYRTTVGWEPTCECNADTRPAIVFDPFFGSGTVGGVAEDLGRLWLGFDISEEYRELQAERTAQVSLVGELERA